VVLVQFFHQREATFVSPFFFLHFHRQLRSAELKMAL
jgi:hypothetical protein